MGLECRTSHLPLRRVFRAGYTEYLEDHIGQLEAKIQKLRLALDQKDGLVNFLMQLPLPATASNDDSVDESPITAYTVFEPPVTTN